MTQFEKVAEGFPALLSMLRGPGLFTPIQLLPEAGQRSPGAQPMKPGAFCASSRELVPVPCRAGRRWQAPDAGEILAVNQKARKSEL